jgi:hexosaminidase
VIRSLVVLLTVVSVAALAAGDGVSVIPRPRSVERADGSFRLASPVRIVSPAGDPRFEDAAAFLRDFLIEKARLSVSRGDRVERGAIVFETADAGSLPASTNGEAYSLAVSPDGIRIRAATAAGAFWAVQTLRQLLPPDVERGAASTPLSVPAVRMTDAPRFAWRGSLVDVGRHYLPPAFIKRFIDLLSLHKMNVLHWHLTEDQGWRLEIKKYPRLTAVGAWRTEPDGARYGGFYTQDQIRDIVDYARRRQVTVVPEIEMPGHASAALVAYPELSCTGDTKAVPATWGVFEDVFCPGKEETFQFLQNVLTEVMALFPSKVIHIGGDEVPKAHWRACALCQQRMKAEGLRDENELQSYFIRRIGSYVRSQGREITGWDEILEGGLPPGTTVQVWRDIEHTRTSVKLAARVVASPTSHAYINSSPAGLPLARVLQFNPVPDGLSADEAARIVGGEATLWSEGIDEANFDAMAFPRLAAFAEALWSGQPQSLAEFKAILDGAHSARLRALGVKYGPEDQALVSLSPVFDPATSRVSVRTEHHVEPLVFRYTTDGTTPTDRSRIYDAATAFDASGTVKVRPFLGGAAMLQSATLTIDRHLAVGKPVTLAVSNSPKYPGTGALTLTDSLLGSVDFHDGTWQGWEGDDMEAVVDLGGVATVRGVEVGALQAMRSWILLPKRVAVWLSDDATTWRQVGDLSHAIPPQREDSFVHRFKQILPAGTRARYVKVRAENAGPLPAWHPGAGGKAWVFVDEIAVR